MDWRKRQIIGALQVSAAELEAGEQGEPDNRGLTVDFEGQMYRVLGAEFVAELVYVLRKAATWMEQEEGENGEKAEAKAAS